MKSSLIIFIKFNDHISDNGGKVELTAYNLKGVAQI